MTMRVAVAVSGRGSNLEALLQALTGRAPARVVLVLSSRPEAGGGKPRPYDTRPRV